MVYIKKKSSFLPVMIFFFTVKLLGFFRASVMKYGLNKFIKHKVYLC